MHQPCPQFESPGSRARIYQRQQYQRLHATLVCLDQLGLCPDYIEDCSGETTSDIWGGREAVHRPVIAYTPLFLILLVVLYIRSQQVSGFSQY